MCCKEVTVKLVIVRGVGCEYREAIQRKKHKRKFRLSLGHLRMIVSRVEGEEVVRDDDEEYLNLAGYCSPYKKIVFYPKCSKNLLTEF